MRGYVIYMLARLQNNLQNEANNWYLSRAKSIQHKHSHHISSKSNLIYSPKWSPTLRFSYQNLVWICPLSYDGCILHLISHLLNFILICQHKHGVWTEYKWGATWMKTWRLRSRKLRLTAVWVPPRWPRDTPLSTEVGTKICLPVAVAQSV
jgi:hypothetical protein